MDSSVPSRNKPPEDPDDIAVDARQKQQGRKSAPTVRLKLNEADIRESFVKGSGPGGQKINKVRSCVQLTHLPTGIQVQCQDARDLISNRAIARKMLAEKVEFHLRGKDSRIGRRVSRVQKQKAKSRSRSRKAQQLRDGVGEESHDEEEEEKEQEQEHEVTHAHPAEGKPG
ncbi:RF-1 domain-containing protein [Tribonema minus]|uniref:RF-1 domain-containing protein n=1 Tax=Tribonema minus TaxID=303371 RepID=A0A836CHX6_9STRA|nr:RF-1 domain-containing protein [Tribonema minus]